MDHGFNKLLLNALVIPLVNGDGWDKGGVFIRAWKGSLLIKSAF